MNHPLPAGLLDWNRVLPDRASTHRAELHLAAGDEVVFFDPVNCIGLLWRPRYGVAQITCLLTAPEFVRAMLARNVALPRGKAMAEWSSAITAGMVSTDDATTFLQIAQAMDSLASADRPAGGQAQPAGWASLYLIP